MFLILSLSFPPTLPLLPGRRSPRLSSPARAPGPCSSKPATTPATSGAWPSATIEKEGAHGSVGGGGDGGYDLNPEASRRPAESSEYNLAARNEQLERGLKSRHIQFLALGGAIGTGLFVGSGAILASTGPAPLLMAYLGMLFVVWAVMNCLAEMATYLPMRGITVPYFVDRFLDPSLAFATGWNVRNLSGQRESGAF